MKKKTLALVFYISLIVISVFIEYWIMVFSIPYFSEDQKNIEYINNILSTTIILLGHSFFLFLTAFSLLNAFKIYYKKDF